MSSFSPRFNDDDQSPATPKTPRATRQSRSSQSKLTNAPQKPTKNVSFKQIAPDSPPLAPKALSFADIDSSTEPAAAAVRKNSREFRRSVSPVHVSTAHTEQAVVKPRERQEARWVKFQNVSLGRARTAKMNYNETVAAAEE